MLRLSAHLATNAQVKVIQRHALPSTTVYGKKQRVAQLKTLYWPTTWQAVGPAQTRAQNQEAPSITAVIYPRSTRNTHLPLPRPAKKQVVRPVGTARPASLALRSTKTSINAQLIPTTSTRSAILVRSMRTEIAQTSTSSRLTSGRARARRVSSVCTHQEIRSQLTTMASNAWHALISWPATRMARSLPQNRIGAGARRKQWPTTRRSSTCTCTTAVFLSFRTRLVRIAMTMSAVTVFALSALPTSLTTQATTFSALSRQRNAK